MLVAIAMTACALVCDSSGKAEAHPVVTTYDLTSVAKLRSSDAGERRRAWDELHAVSALEGIVNRRTAQLYVFLVNGGEPDRFWLERMREKGDWLADAVLEPVASFDALIAKYRRSIAGVVVWDENVPATSNVASTIAGVERLLPVRYDPTPGSMYDRLVVSAAGPRLPVRQWLVKPDGKPLFTGKGMLPGLAVESSGSAKCDAYLWAMERYLKAGRCDKVSLAYYPDAWWLTHDTGVPPERTLLSNHDYFISHGAFFVDLSPWGDEAPDDDPGQPIGTDERTLRAVLRAAYDACHGGVTHVGGFTSWDQKYTDHTGRKHDGVGTEWRYAEILSCFNAFMDADAPGLHAMANASFYCHYPLASRYPQRNLPTMETLRAKGLVGADGRVTKKTFVSIYVGDYDSAAWFYQMMPGFWQDPARGTVPLGWAFDPTLEYRFAPGLAYTRRTATANDTFITGDSGAGYLNPGFLVPPRKWSGLPSGLDAWETHSKKLYGRWDLRVTGFVIDGFAPGMDEATKKAYARFSPDGVVAQKIPEISLVDGVPFLRMGSDLTGSPEQMADFVAGDAPKGGPAFRIYRTILWPPSGHKAMFDKLRSLRPDIEVVDPYTLMLLLKTHLSSKS